MNKLLIAGGTFLALGTMVATGGVALATNQLGERNGNGAGNGGGYSQQLQVKATALKMTTEQLQEQLKTKTLTQVAAEKNVSMDAIHESVQTQAKARWAANGFTPEQIAEREASMTERQADCDGTGTGMGGGQRHGRNSI